MKNFTKRTLGFQILYGIMFSILANPYVIKKYFLNNTILMLLQIVIMSFVFLNLIIKSCNEDIKKAKKINYLRYNKNFFTVFLFSIVETLIFTYMYMKYLVKMNVNPYVYILIPSGIAFFVIQFVSYKLRKNVQNLTS